MPHASEANPLLRRLLVGVALLVTVALLALQLPRLLEGEVLGIDDFAEYWAAGRLNLQARNPYDSDQLHALQVSAGLPEDDPAIIMWNPPWTLTFVMPFGLPGYALGRLIWLLFHLGVVIACADLLWREFGGSVELRWLAWLVALSFCPTLISLKSGQISPMILLGLTGFLCCQRRGHDFAAGVCMILATIKPHLVYLVWVALLLWAIERRRGRVLLGITIAALVSVGIPLLFNPDVIQQYRKATSEQPPTDWVATTFGSLLRLWLGEGKVGLIFLPTVLGLLWFVPYWFRTYRAWNWHEQLPLLLLVSTSTAAYGWLGDQVILVMALMAMAAWLERSPRRLIVSAMAIYALLNLADLGLNIVQRVDAVQQMLGISHRPEHQLWHLWTAPALLLGFLILRARTRIETTAPQHESEPAHA